MAALPMGLVALGHRNFRLYFLGQGVSVFGTWVQQVAMSWLVYRLTGSAELLGLTAFLALAPQLVVGPLAGAWFDRFDRRRLLMAVQLALTLHAGVLALLTAGGLAGAPFLVGMALLLGILNGIDTPLRQSLIGNFLDDKAAIRNALSLNAMLFNAGRFIGPPLAGLILAATSEAVCFGLNALSYLALFATLSVARARPFTATRGQSYLDTLREGFAYAWKDRPVRLLLVMVGLVNLTLSAYAVLAPLFAKEVFQGDERTLGLLIGAAGCGAVAGTLFLTLWHDVRQVLVVMIALSLGGAAAMMLFAAGNTLWIGLGSMAVVGCAISMINVGANGLLQTLAPDALRGRVASLFTACRFGLDAIGGLLAGAIAGSVGAPLTLMAEGAALAVLTLALLPLLAGLAAEVGRRVQEEA